MSRTNEIQEILTLDDRASAGLGKVSAAAKEASGDMDAARGSAVKLDASLESLDAASSRTGESAAKLAGAVSMVSPAAADAVRGIADLADVGEVLAKSGGAAGLSLSSMLAVLGPVAVAAGVLTAVYWDLSSSLEEVEARNDAAAASATRYQLAAEASAAVTQRVADALALQLGETTANQLAARDQIATIEQQRAGMESYWREIIAATDALSATGSATVEDIARRHRARIELAAYRSETEELTGTVQLLADEEDRAAAAAARASAAAAAERANAARAATQARAAAEDERAAKAEQQLMERELREDQAAAAEDRRMEAEASQLAHEEEWQSIHREIEATAQLAAERKAAADSAIRSTTAGVTGGPQSGLNALSNAGPMGEMIAGIADMVVTLDQTGDEFTNFHVTFLKAIENFPKILMDNIGDWIAKGSQAVATLIPNLIANLIATLFDPETWAKMGEQLWKGFIEGNTIGRFKDDDGKVTGKSTGEGFLHFLGGGLFDWFPKEVKKAQDKEASVQASRAHQYDLGGYVAESGLAMVHQGEWIKSAQGVNSQGPSGATSRGAGGATIIVHATAVTAAGAAELVREINRQMRQQGLDWAR